MSGVPLLLADVVAASRAVAATRSRLAKSAALAELLARAEPDEVAPVVSWLAGELTQRQIGVGWAALKDPVPPAEAELLTVSRVEAAFTALGALTGPGSATARRAGGQALLGAATAGEQEFLMALLGGGLRQGALAGLMADAVAKAAGVPTAAVRRALTLHGDLAAIAALALGGGQDALDAVRLEEIGRAHV